MNLAFSDLYEHALYQAKMSPNGQYIANSLDKRLVIRDNSKKLTVLMVHPTPKPIDYIEWSPNSEYILTCNYESGRIDIRSMIDTTWHAVIREGRASLTKVKWSFDSKKILYITELKLILAIWDLSTSELKYINHPKFSDKGIEYSPDGNFVAIARKEKGKDCISIYHGSSFILLEHFEVDTVDMQNFKWSPDGMFISVWDNSLYHKLLVYRQDGTLCANYSGYEYGLGIKSVCWSPNRELLAIGNFDQTIHLLSINDWKLVGLLRHPATITTSMNTKILEEIILPPLTGLNQSRKMANHQYLTKRPYNVSTSRPGYNQPNPKVGIGLCQFSVDGLYIYSRNDNMPNLLWIWDVKTLKCHTIIKFNQPVRQVLWNPLEPHLLVVICGDEKMHYFQPTDNELGIITLSVPFSDFSIKKSKWNSNGDALILMDTGLFCLAVM